VALGEVRGSEKSVQDPEVLPSEKAMGAFDNSTVQRTMAEDPLVGFILRFWLELLVATVVAVVAYFAYNAFQNAARENTEKAADLYLRVRDSYAGLLGDIKSRSAEKDAAKIDELSKKIASESEKYNEAVRVLGDRQAPYKDIAALYRTLGVLAQGGDIQAVQISEWKNIRPDASERLFAELNALALGRGLLDSGPQGKSRGIGVLKDLTQDGVIAYASAAVTVADIAESAVEKADAKAMLQRVLAAHPDQAEVIEPALKKLG